MPSLLLLWLLLRVSLPTTAPKTYYLTPTGSDTADGLSPQTAWQTVNRANKQQFMPGDQVLFQGGSQFTGMLTLTAEDAGTPTLPVTITSFGQGQAILQNPDTSAISISDAGGMVVKNLLLKSPDRTKNRGCGLRIINTLPQADQRQFIRVDSVTASGFGQDGICLGGAARDGSQSGFTDVRISHCVLFDNQYHGLFITGIWDTNASGYANHHLQITHCLVYENTGDPLFLANHSGSGMEIDDVEDAQITYCAAYRNGFLCNARVGGPCGIWLHAANRSTIQHCVAIGNRTGRGLDGAGFDLDGGTTYCRIEHCYARDNDGAGILVWNYDQAPHRLGDNVICHNILENNGIANNYADIHMGTSGTPLVNMLVYQNTVFSSRQPMGNQRCIWIGPNSAVAVLNNLLISNNGAGYVDSTPNQPSVQLRGNLIWATNGQTRLQAGAQFGNPRLAALNTDESPTPITLQQLRGYRPLPASPLGNAGIHLSAYPIPRPLTGFWGKPSGERAVGAGN